MSNTKWIIEHTPGRIKLTERDKGFYLGKRQWTSKKKTNISKEERQRLDEANMRRSIRRTAKKIEAIISSNFANDKEVKMITLTYKSNMESWTAMLRHWSKFRRLFPQIIKKKWKYIAVIERQQRGAWHLHIVTSFPFVKWEKVIKLWRRCCRQEGGCWISQKTAREDSITYLSSYLNDPDYVREQRYPPGKRRYWTNLKDKTVKTYCSTPEVIDDLLDMSNKEGMIKADYSVEIGVNDVIRTRVIHTDKIDYESHIYATSDYKERMDARHLHEREFQRKYS